MTTTPDVGPAEAGDAGNAPGGTHRVRIAYCPRCRWLMRAAWMGQELLLTFERDLAEVALAPAGTGTFEVQLDGQVVWSRAVEGRFPELKELKQRIRDRIAPARALGHSDAGARTAGPSPADQ